MAHRYSDATVRDPSSTSTLNRPEVRNAFNDEVIAELTAWAARAAHGCDAARRRAERRRQGLQRRRRRELDGADDRLLARREPARRDAHGARCF